MLRKFLAAGTLSFVFLWAVPVSTQAQADSTTNCWGVVTSQLAQSSTGAVGDHSSSESTPRIGLANVALALFNEGVIGSPHISALAIFLAEIDGVPETQCGG